MGEGMKNGVAQRRADGAGVVGVVVRVMVVLVNGKGGGWWWGGG